MIYSVMVTNRAKRDIARLPKPVAKNIYLALKDLSYEKNPKEFVKTLKGSRKNPFYSLWIGEYRAILNIEDNVMIIHVIEAGHRNKIYRSY